MVRKKKENVVPMSVIKIVGVGVLALLVGIFVYKQGVNIFIHSAYFKVDTIVVDPSLQFIQKRDLKKLKGHNIFAINLSVVQKKLQKKYPQASSLRVGRKFPNRLMVTAKKRKAFIQVKMGNKYFIIDNKAVILSVADSVEERFPYVEGIVLSKDRMNLGSVIRGRNVRVAIRIVTVYNNYLNTLRLRIKSIDLRDSAKINLHLSNHLRIIMDGDNIDTKMQVLSLVLTEKDINFKNVKYLDLRFKEPILGKK